MATANVLSAQWLAAIIAQSLPPSASPQLKTPYDAIAIAVHAALIAVGFRLIGLNEDERLPPCPPESVPELPEAWNLQSPANFSFVYAHSQSSMDYLVRVNRMGGKAVIMGMGVGDDKNITFDVKIDEYISASSLPATPVSASDLPSRPVPTTSGLPSTPQQVEVPQHLKQSILNIFISAGRLSDFVALTRLRLIQKLLPSLHKDGYEETTTSNSTSNSTSTPRPSRPPPDRDAVRPQPPLHDPLAMPPRRPQVPTGEFLPPGFEDEYDLTRPPRPLGGPFGGGGGAGYGHRDLYPAGLGPNDPFRGIGPGLQGGGGGGMHPTFDDPLFQGQGTGGYGYDPQAPPGARFDPTGPGGAPRGNGGGGFPGRGLGGGPRNPFGGFGGGDFI